MTTVQRLAIVFEEVFGHDHSRFSKETVPEDVANWDSMGHMNLVSRLETDFGVQFELDEIMEMASAAKIMEVLETKGVRD